ncbi:hypothetical protein [Azospirillum sp. B506]|uniref:hypothetical protein n=1 Tax=Azospirillum sp. B506 TaxID=137721 RepID=UPI000347DD86|nr:hypothetical protein [Azospirillum sp. B506]
MVVILYVNPVPSNKLARRLAEPGEARLVERAFNLGPCVLAEAVQFISQKLELQAA